MLLRLRFLPVFWLSGLLLLAACRPAPDTPPASPSPAPSPVPSATNTLVPPSPSPVPSPAPSLTPPPAPTATPAAASLDDLPLSATAKASFLGETYPDYTIVQPGESFVKTWTLANTGDVPWTTGYALVRGAVPQGQTLGTEARIPLVEEVAPGGKTTLSVPMTAPQAAGTYTVYFLLLTPEDEIVPVDGGRSVWATIRVCPQGQGCPTPPALGGSQAQVGDISARLLAFTPGTPQTSARFCMTLPNRNYGPSPGTVFLQVDDAQLAAVSGGSLPSAGCFEFSFAVSEAEIAQAAHVSVVVEQVRVLGGSNNPDQDCRNARETLMAQYPGLDFTCQFSMSGYYTDLHLPPGMSPQQADRLITDAIEHAVDGPWVLSVR